MSRSNHPRPSRNRMDRLDWGHGGWILESPSKQRHRLNQEVRKFLRDPEHEVQLTLKGPKNAYDYP